MERICGGTETKETELDVLQRQWNKGAKEIGGRCAAQTASERQTTLRKVPVNMKEKQDCS